MIACGFALLLSTSFLLACGSSSPTLGTATIETAIAKSILLERRAQTNVSCPAHVAQKAGEQFTCSAALRIGSYPVTVTETDAKGHVRWNSHAALVVLNQKKVTSSIEQSVLTQRGADSIVSCPTNILQKKGLTFRCTARVAKATPKVHVGTYPFTVTEVDNSGHVHYVGD
jgi:Domain of unknown function (DUF4333)